jgi:hypothetical protein
MNSNFNRFLYFNQNTFQNNMSILNFYYQISYFIYNLYNLKKFRNTNGMKCHKYNTFHHLNSWMYYMINIDYLMDQNNLSNFLNNLNNFYLKTSINFNIYSLYNLNMTQNNSDIKNYIFGIRNYHPNNFHLYKYNWSIF